METFVLFCKTWWYLTYHFVPALILLGVCVYRFRIPIRTFFDWTACRNKSDFERVPCANVIAIGVMCLLFSTSFVSVLCITDSVYYISFNEELMVMRIPELFKTPT